MRGMILSALLLASVFCHLVHLCLTAAATTLLTSVTCPCQITIAVTHHAPNFDLLVHTTARVKATSPTNRLHTVFTKLNRTGRHAAHHDALFDYHILRVPLPIRISLRVRRATKSTKLFLPFPTSTSFRVLSTSIRGSHCPSLLEQHPTRRQLYIQTFLNNPTLTFSSSFSSSSSPHHTTHHNARKLTPRIVGGEPSGEDLAKYLVYFLIPAPDGWRACSGTLVAPRIVITAAHCKVNELSSAFIGGTRGKLSDGVKKPIAWVSTRRQFMSHGGANPRRFSYDIAIVHLSEDAHSGAKFMKVNVNQSVPLEGSVVRAAGYGILRHADSESNLNSVLHQVDVPVVPKANCVPSYASRGIRVDYKFQVCAGYIGRGGCDSCQGDSGGPLFQYDKEGAPVLLGVVSIGVACADANFPGVYVRTAAHNAFIPSDVNRTFRTQAIFSTYQPPRIPNRMLIISAVAGGLVVVVAIFAIVAVIVRKRREASQSAAAAPTENGPIINTHAGHDDGFDPSFAPPNWPPASQAFAPNYSTASLYQPMPARAGAPDGGAPPYGEHERQGWHAADAMPPNRYGVHVNAPATPVGFSAQLAVMNAMDPRMATAENSSGNTPANSAYAFQAYDPYEGLRTVNASSQPVQPAQPESAVRGDSVVPIVGGVVGTRLQHEEQGAASGRQVEDGRVAPSAEAGGGDAPIVNASDNNGAPE